MEDFITGTIALFGNPTSVAVFIAGLVGGMVFAAIPGITMMTLCAILLPFSAKLSASDAIMLFSVIYCSGVFGGAITAILFNIPGAPENAPTALDGYPMAQQGKASKAVGAAVLCSAVGGLCSAVLMMIATPAIANWAVSSISAPEIFAIVFFGLAVASSVGAKTLLKGWLSVLFGLLIAIIGMDPIAGVKRYDFGVTYLLAGIHFVPMILGFFAVSEVFVQLERQVVKGIEKAPKVSLEFPTLREFWKLKIAIPRSVFIGFFAGILPGIGSTLAAFMGYNEAVRWSKHPERFGKGELEGVVSAETANNAATGAAMIPLLALGLPGGALTAIMIGVFQIHGIEAGPLVFTNSKELVWIVFSAMFFANFAILILGWVETKTVVHLLRIPFRYLGPAILVFGSLGAFAIRGLVMDVVIMYVAGIAGFFLRRTGYSVAGIVLGLILGQIGEQNFAQAMQMVHYDFLAFVQRPIAGFLLAAGVLTIGVSIFKNFFREKK